MARRRRSIASRAGPCWTQFEKREPARRFIATWVMQSALLALLHLAAEQKDGVPAMLHPLLGLSILKRMAGGGPRSVSSGASTIMSRVAVFALAVVALLVNRISIAAEPISAAAFHSKVVSIYSFEPHTLGKENFPVKSAELDEFWSFVKANTRETLPLLRSELSSPSHSSFFFYDGAKLLLSLSESKEDRALALRSLPKANLQDVEHSDYLMTVHWFAQNGFDTREAALRILAFPDFKAFIPQHALTLAQNYSLIYMLFPMPETSFVGDLAQRLERETDAQAQKSLLLSLWYTVTPAGDAAMKAFSERTSSSAENLAYARQLLSRGAGVTASSSTSVSSLREKRTRLMQQPISDEALSEFDELTRKLLSAGK